MKFILTPNRKEPYNLIQISFADNPIDQVIIRSKETGLIPCESEEERAEMLELYVLHHPTWPLIELPPVGQHWIVEEADLPDNYFFDAWQWED